MSTCHVSESRDPGSTQWEDIHRRLGNFAAKPKEVTTNEVEKLLVDAAEMYDPLADKSLKQLDGVEDDFEEDALAKYRRERMAELKAASKAAKFGKVRHIRKDDFVHEVTEASANGQWVLVMLFVESSSACQQLMVHWDGAAAKFPAVKFLKGKASEVVDNFPDDRTPTVLFYRNEDCEKQLVGIGEWGGRRCDLDCIEWVLAKHGVVETEMEDDPREGATRQVWQRAAEGERIGGDDSNSESDPEDRRRNDRCYASSKLQQSWMRKR